MVKPSETLPENVNDPASGLMVIDVQRERWGEREQNKGDFVTFAVVEPVNLSYPSGSTSRQMLCCSRGQLSETNLHPN